MTAAMLSVSVLGTPAQAQSVEPSIDATVTDQVADTSLPIDTLIVDSPVEPTLGDDAAVTTADSMDTTVILPVAVPAPEVLNLRNAKLSNANKRGVYFVGADLYQAKMDGADFTGANLSGASLIQANIQKATFVQANLTGVVGNMLSATSANLSQAIIYQARLSQADFSKADLRSADLRQTDLSRAILKSADLRGADLRGADLSQADLSGANLTGADLTGALHTGAIFKSVITGGCTGCP
jgi:hypothetical protein